MRTKKKNSRCRNKKFIDTRKQNLTFKKKLIGGVGNLPDLPNVPKIKEVYPPLPAIPKIITET